jgi:RNA polymerase sigma-70 factor (ECF subfamily)
MRFELAANAVSDRSDEELIALLRESPGSPRTADLYRELFQRHHHRVAAWCLRFTGNREAALDLAQEVFLKAYRRLEAFRGDSRFSTWLYTIARNHCVTAAKRWSTEPAEVGRSVSLHLADAHSTGVHETIEREQMLRLLRRLVAESLNETEAQVMTLHYYQELPLDVITRLLDLRNPSGAKAYIVSARRKLAAAMQSRTERPAGAMNAA